MGLVNAVMLGPVLHTPTGKYCGLCDSILSHLSLPICCIGKSGPSVRGVGLSVELLQELEYREQRRSPTLNETLVPRSPTCKTRMIILPFSHILPFLFLGDRK